MQEIINTLGLLGLGTILGSIMTIGLRHFLDKSKIDSQRKYEFGKEEFFYYRKMSEDIIKKLLLLDNQRDLLKVYFESIYKASIDKSTKFIDVNDTFNKDKFEKDVEEVATMLFIYFPELGKDWDECMEFMSKMFTCVFVVDLEVKDGLDTNWEEKIKIFNDSNTELGDKPVELSRKILEICREKEQKVV